MVILDRSGSMDSTPSGSGTGPSKLDIARMAITTLMMKYGNTIPFGFTTFQEDLSCTDGIDILVEPMHASAQAITQKVAAVVSGGGTNTGQAIDKVAADPNMHDPMRPSSYIMLITDGEPNCGAGGLSEPAYTVSRISAAAMAANPIKTFVIGFGALPSADQMAMDQMATAGLEPCMGTTCNGHKFFAADSAQALNDAIDAISQTIAGEFGGQCDDSCYANGCPNAGDICVGSKCKPDPCSSVASVCAPGDYCYTDGNSAGTCSHACSMPCAAGEVCSAQGMCVPDLCATVSCQTGQVCKAGQCINDACNGGTGSKPCDPGLLCYQGSCIDDPCRYVTCPMGTTCVTGSGACAATLTGGNGMGGTGGRNRGAGGCDFGSGASSTAGLAALLMLAAGLWLRARRRRA